MCPASRTKISVPLVRPQNRHREAIDRVTQSLWRGVEGTSAMLILPMLFGAFLGSHTGTLYPYDAEFLNAA